MEIQNCKIIENKKIGENYYILKLENKFKEKFLPGQFLHIKIPENFLRRPFSVASFTDSFISILYQVVGTGTKKLSEKKEGEILNVIGPCGNSFPVKKEYKKICIIAGGIGVAPLIFLAEEILKKKKEIYFFYGAKNKNFIPFEILPYGPGYFFSTDDGSYGKKGNVFELFKKTYKKLTIEVIYGAGPEPLLKKISEFSKKIDIPSYISVENYMGCGMGLCYGCVVKIKGNNSWEYKRVCKDGPVFEAKNIIWK